MNNLTIKDDIQKLLQVVNLDKMKGKDVLLTGASGLIGTYLAFSVYIANQHYFENEKIHFSVVVHTELPEHLREIEKEEWLHIYQGDLADYEFCVSLPKADYIIHAAGYGQPGKFMEDQVKTIKINTLCTGVLLDKLNINGSFLFISTSEVYSNSFNTPYKETEHGTTMPDHTRACYIEGKRCGEALCNAYADKGNRIKIARVALAYGPGIKNGDKRVLYNFIQKALYEGEISMLDSGQGKRVYSYIADTVEILWKILLQGKEVTYNVGGESDTTILDLALKIGAIIGVEVLYSKTDDGLNGAPNEVSIDITKIKTEFNKTEFVSLDQGLSQTINWYRENLYTKSKLEF